MNKKHPLLLVILIGYVLMPIILAWATDIDGHWFRPFIIWLAVIAAAYSLQQWKKIK